MATAVQTSTDLVSVLACWNGQWCSGWGAQKRNTSQEQGDVTPRPRPRPGEGIIREDMPYSPDQKGV